LKKISIGFTGTRKGMTREQMKALLKVLQDINFAEAHHGDCVGADEQFHRLVRIFFPDVVIVIHPPKNPKLRAFCKGDVIMPEKDYLERNRDIVKNCDLLIACPKEFHEVLRSGTWATVRYARKAGKPIIIIFPDGNIKKE